MSDPNPTEEEIDRAYPNEHYLTKEEIVTELAAREKQYPEAAYLASQEKQYPIVRKIRIALEKVGELLKSVPPGSNEEQAVALLIDRRRDILGSDFQIITQYEIDRVKGAFRQGGEIMTEMDKKRRHRSKKPDLKHIKKVKAYREAGHSWPETDKEFNYEPDGARQLIVRAKKNGWI